MSDANFSEEATVMLLLARVSLRKIVQLIEDFQEIASEDLRDVTDPVLDPLKEIAKVGLQ